MTALIADSNNNRCQYGYLDPSKPFVCQLGSVIFAFPDLRKRFPRPPTGFS